MLTPLGKAGQGQRAVHVQHDAAAQTWFWQHFERHLGQQPQAAETACHQARNVVACDVLHDFSAETQVLAKTGDDPCAQQARGVNQQRNVVALQAQLLERWCHVRDLADARVVIAKQHEDGVFVVTARLGQLHQPPDIEIQQAHRVVLLHAARTGGLDLLHGLVADLKTVVVFGNGKRPVIARSLHVGKERFVGWQRTQDPVTLLEQVQVGNPPHIHLR